VGTVSSDGDTAARSHTLLHALFVLSIAKVNLKVVDGRHGSGGIQLSRAIQAADSGKILIFDFLAGWKVVRVGHGG
jgi:hypothetical protein